MKNTLNPIEYALVKRFIKSVFNEHNARRHYVSMLEWLNDYNYIRSNSVSIRFSTRGDRSNFHECLGHFLDNGATLVRGAKHPRYFIVNEDETKVSCYHTFAHLILENANIDALYGMLKGSLLHNETPSIICHTDSDWERIKWDLWHTTIKALRERFKEEYADVDTLFIENNLKGRLNATWHHLDHSFYTKEEKRDGNIKDAITDYKYLLDDIYSDEVLHLDYDLVCGGEVSDEEFDKVREYVSCLSHEDGIRIYNNDEAFTKEVREKCLGPKRGKVMTYKEFIENYVARLVDGETIDFKFINEDFPYSAKAYRVKVNGEVIYGILPSEVVHFGVTSQDATEMADRTPLHYPSDEVEVLG